MEMENPKEERLFDVIVVGGGIMGSCVAHCIAARGHSVLLLEQFDFLHHRGSSHGESRTIRAAYSNPLYTTMVLESYRLWDMAQSQIGYQVLHPTSHLDLGPSSDPTLQSVISSCRENSVKFRVLDCHAVAEEFSGRVTIPEDWIGIISEAAGVIKATKAVSMFHSLALQNGVVLMDNTEVTTIERSNQNGVIVVRTAKGQKFMGRKCVVTTGAWTKQLVKRVTGREIPIQPLETTICYWKIKEGHQDDYNIERGFPSFTGHSSPHVYGTPSLEFPGLIKVSVHAGQACDPDKRAWGDPGTPLEPLRKWVKEIFAGRVDPNGPVMMQGCMYSMTPDEDYVIDFAGGELGKDVVVACGFSGHGFKMGPAVGRVVADMALYGHAEGVALQHFKLSRFDKNPNGNVKEFA